MSAERTSIAFVGFMGAGKSTAARRLARELGLDLADTDELIAAEAGTSIPTLFATKGEARFREIEERVVLAALERGGVVALGGGAVESEAVRAALADHLAVWCQVSEDLAWSRSAGTDRPLARDRKGFGGRYRARAKLYEEVARVHLPCDKQLAGLLGPWLAALREEPGVAMIWAHSPSADYPALIGAGATRLFDALGVPRPGARTFVAADRAALAAAGGLLPDAVETPPIDLDGGEEAKSLAAAEQLLERLIDAGVRRDDALLAFGGGVVGDLAGFCAAVYQRGIPVVQVPTTLVAQVDSAYGGKTGVDLAAAKNYVGAFHQPAAVLADPAALATLPEAELAAGFAEVVKTALIAGGRLWDRVRALERPDAQAIAPLIFDCARTKIEIVAADERDGGRRAVLNLGHTVGHAIEAASGYSRYRHGEAVALGTLATLRLSGQEDLHSEVGELLARAGLPTQLDPAVDVDAVLAAAGRDKKRTADGIGFVLVEAPGNVVHGRRVDADSLRDAVVELQES
ncbi:MAG: bifunctional shikimate kinase/3-dehydroquinate synthase [Solirubrobacterales bacterium]|nr:bifunctional shikimate kinase/3-dehydroquinate synthase [Solirubrobacterales bacterium]